MTIVSTNRLPAARMATSNASEAAHNLEDFLAHHGKYIPPAQLDATKNKMRRLGDEIARHHEKLQRYLDTLP